MCTCKICTTIPVDAVSTAILINHVQSFKFAENPLPYFRLAETLRELCYGPLSDDTIPYVVPEITRLAAHMLLDSVSRQLGIEMLQVINKSYIGLDMSTIYANWNQKSQLLEASEFLCLAAFSTWDECDIRDEWWVIIWTIAQIATTIECCPLQIVMNRDEWMRRLMHLYKSTTQVVRVEIAIYITDLLHSLRQTSDTDILHNRQYYNNAVNALLCNY